MTKKLISYLIDWLVVLLAVTGILWFAFTLPVFSLYQSNQVLPIVSQKALKNHVETLLEDYSPRTIEFGNLNITAHYIYDELKQFGRVEYQPFWTLGGRYSNVLLELGPDTKEVFVIGAHYDAESSSLDIEGNASGVATLIELARHLSETEEKLPIRVQLLAYPLSQKDLTHIENMGSYNHAQSLRKSQVDIRLMISLDSVGRFNNHINSQEYPYKFLSIFYPDKGNYISLIGRVQDSQKIRQLKKSFVSASALPLYSFNVLNDYSPVKSQDHLNYQRHGFPAILITDTANYRKVKAGNPVEQLDFEKMAMLVRSLYQVVMDSDLAKPIVQVAQQQ